MINFYGKRKIFFTISLSIFVIGCVFLFMKGIHLDITFKGGAILKYTYEGDIDTTSVQNKMNSTLKVDSVIQTAVDYGTNTKKLSVSFSSDEKMSTEKNEEINAFLTKELPNNKITSSSSNIVDPYIGRTFFEKGIISLILASIGIVLYVWFRFKKISGFSAGVVGLIALLHDCLIVFFAYVIFDFPVNETFIAVTLTIIGYSINDTIVIYDRIRENKKLLRGESVENLVNISITQTLPRSINTSAATIFCVLTVMVFAYLFQIDSIKTFAFTMALGLFSGCYSTVCIAGPLWVMWQKRKEA